jgi:hypothetical protein
MLTPMLGAALCGDVHFFEPSAVVGFNIRHLVHLTAAIRPWTDSGRGRNSLVDSLEFHDVLALSTLEHAWERLESDLLRLSYPVELLAALGARIGKAVPKVFSIPQPKGIHKCIKQCRLVDFVGFFEDNLLHPAQAVVIVVKNGQGKIAVEDLCLAARERLCHG